MHDDVLTLAAAAYLQGSPAAKSTAATLAFRVLQAPYSTLSCSTDYPCVAGTVLGVAALTILVLQAPYLEFSSTPSHQVGPFPFFWS